MTRTTYAIGLGSNRWSRFGPPARALDAAVSVLAAEDMEVLARSPLLATPAMGGAGRRFVNATLLVETDLSPPELMRTLQAIERAFGRRPGRRWGPRVLDLDILLWSQGAFPGERQGSALSRSMQPDRLGSGVRRGTPVVPHPGLPTRAFVLKPLFRIAPTWRVPPTGHTVRHLRARLARPRPVDRAGLPA